MLKEHVDVFVNFLQDENLCVRQSAINLLGALNVSSNKVIDALRQTMATNEIYLASEAAFTMLKLKPDEAENLMPFLTQTLDSDDPKPKHHVIENVDLLGRHAEQLLPRIGELLDDSCLGFDAALAILTITGDDSCARQLVEKWRSGEAESEFDCTEPFYPDLLLQVADELEESIRRIQSKRHS